MSREATKIERAAVNGTLDQYYKDPKAFQKQAIGILERNVKCRGCGAVGQMKVLDYEQKKMRCNKCGREE